MVVSLPAASTLHFNSFGNATANLQRPRTLYVTQQWFLITRCSQDLSHTIGSPPSIRHYHCHHWGSTATAMCDVTSLQYAHSPAHSQRKSKDYTVSINAKAASTMTNLHLLSPRLLIQTCRQLSTVTKEHARGARAGHKLGESRPTRCKIQYEEPSNLKDNKNQATWRTMKKQKTTMTATTKPLN
jgi:hypothetical protein